MCINSEEHVCEVYAQITLGQLKYFVMGIWFSWSRKQNKIRPT